MRKLKTRKSQIAYAVSSILALASSNLYAADASENEGDKEAERVIVTGSLIRRAEFNSEQPVDIIKADDAAAAGIKNIGELLRSITAASGSAQITAATSTEQNVSGGDGVETIGLRGLGANRTLVLLNGRRAGPAGIRGGVASFDFNVLPIAAVDRVEVLKDGASSLYGSDAIAGVINIITKKGDGGEVNVFTSNPEKSGGESHRISATWGTSFENGSFRVVADHNKQVELSRGQRDYLTCGKRNFSDPATGANRDPIDPRTGKPVCYEMIWGHMWVYDYSAGLMDDEGNPLFELSLAQFDYDGSLGAVPGLQDPAYRYPNTFDPNNPDQIVTPAGWYRARFDRLSDSITNADHPFQNAQTAIPESVRSTIFAQGDLQLGGVNTYAELLLNRRKTKINSYQQIWGYVYNENSNGNMTDNPDPSVDGWSGNNWLSPLTITDHSDSSTQVDYLRAVVGANGDIGDWFWDASYQFSRSKGRYTVDEIFDSAVRSQDWDDGSFSSTCPGLSNPNGAPCAVAPWMDPGFLAGDIPADVAAYWFTTQTGKTIYEQSAFEFVVSGDLFSLPTGTLGSAFGVSLRTDKINDTPPDIWLNDESWNNISAGITKGSETTKAVFAEFKVPLLSNLPAVESLELSLSGRYTDTESSGSANTYKAGLSWMIGNGFSVRASKGTSFRAPALFELYLADETSSIAQKLIDVCANWGGRLLDGSITQRIADNCASEGIPDNKPPGAIEATVFTGGGKGDLKSETSTADTVGIVWNSEDSDFAVALDYFEFHIKDEVTILGAENIVYQCYNSPNYPTDPLCNLFSRADGSDGTTADGRIEPVRDKFINIAQQRNRGLDLSVDYSAEMFLGKLSMQLRATHQKESSREVFIGTFKDENGMFGEPKNTASFTAAVENGEWTYNWSMQYFDAVSNYRDSPTNGIEDYHGEDIRLRLSAPAYSYHSLSVQRVFADTGWQAMIGVANLFDKQPPSVSTRLTDLQYIGNSALYSQYDLIGRRFFADVTYKF